jgi:hypothetical protein
MIKTRTAALFAVLVLLGAVSYKAAYAVSSRASAAEYLQSDSSVPVHAFVYADHTVIELDSYSSALTIKDDSDGTIGFTRDGRYARLDGKLNHFTAFVDGHSVVFTRKGWTAPKLISVDFKTPTDSMTVADSKPVAASGAVAKAPVAVASAAGAARASLGLAPNETLVSVPAAPHASSAVAVAGSPSAPPILATKSAPSARPALPASSPTEAPIKAAATATPPLVASSASVAPEKTAGSVPLDVATVTLAASAAVAAPAQPPVPLWTLRQGRLVGNELREMAGRAGWNLVWQLQRDIVVPADTTYSGDFETAAGDVITTLRSNGLLIHAKFYQGNKTMVVSGPGTVPQ